MNESTLLHNTDPHEFREQIIADLIKQFQQLLNANASKQHVTDTKRLLTYAELSEALQISEATIRRYKNAGRIPFIAIGDAIRFDFDQVVKSLSSGSPDSEDGDTMTERLGTE